MPPGGGGHGFEQQRASASSELLASPGGTRQLPITAYWDRLSADANVIAPLAPAQRAPLYGMLKDQFSVTWVLDVVSEYAAA